jgi:carboxymethylenebutenolidase
MKTEMVSFAGNGDSVDGFLARPDGDGPFPGVIVVQEWWGLNDNIKDIAKRFADEGFAALAPDLYHGKVTAEPNEAQKAMMALDQNRAAKELAKGADWLASQPYLQGKGIGATGFCMGGGLAMTLACDSSHIKAAAPFYGANPTPVDKVASLQGPVFAVYAENDSWVNDSVRQELETALQQHGKQFETKTYPGTHHGFFNDTRQDVYHAEASKDAWGKVLSLFRENL